MHQKLDQTCRHQTPSGLDRAEQTAGVLVRAEALVVVRTVVLINAGSFSHTRLYYAILH